VKSIALVLVSVAALSACGGKGSSPAAAPATNALEAATTTVRHPSPWLDPADDHVAQTSLRNALTAALVIATDDDSLDHADVEGLRPIEPSLKYQNSASTAPNEVSVEGLPLGQTWWATVKSRSGTCFGIEAKSGSFPPTITYAGYKTYLASCRAPTTDPGWTDSDW